MEGEVLSEAGPAEVGFEAYGVSASLSTSSADLLARAQPLLPPGWTPCTPSGAGRHFSLSEVEGGYEVTVSKDSGDSGGAGLQPLDLEMALGMLDAKIRAYVALQAPEWIFVHAGVVGHAGQAIVVPGLSFSGKTTLVAALVRAGATYYSDEFAVLDEHGLVHPYPKPLSIRDERGRGVDRPAADLGAAVGSEPLPVALVAVTSYRPGARWEPEARSAAAGAMALFANTVPARDRPEQALAAVRKAASPAVALEGERGEAAVVAADLLNRCRSL